MLVATSFEIWSTLEYEMDSSSLKHLSTRAFLCVEACSIIPRYTGIGVSWLRGCLETGAGCCTSVDVLHGLFTALLLIMQPDYLYIQNCLSIHSKLPGPSSSIFTRVSNTCRTEFSWLFESKDPLKVNLDENISSRTKFAVCMRWTASVSEFRFICSSDRPKFSRNVKRMSRT